MSGDGVVYSVRGKMRLSNHIEWAAKRSLAAVPYKAADGRTFVRIC